MASNATYESAKSAMVEVRDEVVSLAPAASIAETRNVDEATLMDCTKDEFSWPGSSTLVMQGEWDSEQFLNAVAGAFDGREGWTVTDSIATEQMVKATETGGMVIFTSVVKDGGEIWVRGFSECFPFDPAIGKKY